MGTLGGAPGRDRGWGHRQDCGGDPGRDAEQDPGWVPGTREEGKLEKAK